MLAAIHSRRSAHDAVTIESARALPVTGSVILDSLYEIRSSIIREAGEVLALLAAGPQPGAMIYPVDAGEDEIEE